MVDRRLIGIVVIAFSVSSAAFSFIVGEKVDEPLEILKNEWNLPALSDGVYRMPSEEGRYAYGIGLVARKPMERLELFFATLENETSRITDPRYSPRVNLTGASPWESFIGLAEAGKLAEATDNYAEHQPMRLPRESFELTQPAATLEGFLLDLTDPEIGTAPKEVPRTLRTVHAILKVPGEDAYSQYFRGHRDFFIDRDSTIIDLSIQHNQNLTKFAQRTTEQGTAISMELAPPDGYVAFEDVVKEDQIFLSFAVNPAMVTTRNNMIHVVLIYVDGEFQGALATTLLRR